MSGLLLSEAPALELIKEQKLYQLLPGSSPADSFEATGVSRKGEHFFVIFDDTPHIARLHNSLTVGHEDNILFRRMVQTVGYVDITYVEHIRQFLILTKPKKDKGGNHRPKINEYTADLQFLDADWVDFTLEGNDRRLEGLEMVYFNGQEYFLGLCEGNKCYSGRKGRKPGGGRIHVFQNEGIIWAYKETIKLPKELQFEDYTSMAVLDRRVAIASQLTSAVWIGDFQEDSWELVDEGKVYEFPKNRNGYTIYCNIEGVTWSEAGELVVVSNQRRRGQNRRCRKTDQSIHIFKIPEIIDSPN
jgi:hypothetical protein